MFVRSIICVTMRDLAQMIFSINNKSWKGMLRMLNKNMGKSALMTALITGSVIWGGTVVHAEEPQQFLLDEYVVTATRTPVKLLDANANISVITQKEIEDNHYENLEEAVRNVPGVQFLSYGLAGYSASAFRINGADNTVVLIDGVRANHAGSAFQASYTNIDNVERIEVLKGAASALYGADAKGGVINIITKKPQGNKTKFTVSTGNFSSENYALHNEGKDKSWGYAIDISKNKQGDIKDGSGRKWLQDSDAENISFKVVKDLGDGSDLSFGYDQSKLDWLYENTKQYVANNGRITYGDTEEKSWSARWNQKIDDTLINKLSIRNSEYTRNSINSKTPDKMRTTNYKTLSISDYLTKTYGDTHIVTLGIDYVRDNDVEKNKTAYGNIYSKAVYIQDEWKFDKKWDLTTGLRFDDHSWAGSKTTPRANLGYKFNDKTNMYVSYSEFFVAPTISNYTYSLGNPNIKPEEGKSYEIGVNHQFDDSFSLSAHAFKRKTNNRIKYVNVGPGMYDGMYVNAAKEDAKGFDIQLSKIINKNWAVYTGYTYLHFEAEGYGDNNNGYFPKHAINVGVTYDTEKFNANLNARASIDRGVGEGSVANMFPANNYWIFDIATNYKATKNIKFFAKVNNLFDKYYAEQTNVPYLNAGEAIDPYNYYAMPGRNFLVGMEYTF